MRFIAHRQHYGKTAVHIGKRLLKAKVADTFFKKLLGLMYFPEQKWNECMIFVFGFEGNHGLWMRNMQFPIDAIWLDSDKRIVHIEKSMQPCRSINCRTYSSAKGSKYVIELRDGFVKRNRIKINDVAEFSL